MSETEEDVSEKQPISVWKRLLVAGGVVVLLLVAAGFAQRYMQQARAQALLEQAMAELDESDPGWRWNELEAARPSLPDDRNSARTLMSAYRLLPKGALDYKVMQRFDEMPPPPELLDSERLALLQKELRAASAALAQARKLEGMPAGRHVLNLAPNPLATLLPDQQNTRAITSLLQYDALDLANKGKAREALLSGRAALNAARSLDDEPFLISQLVRIACVSVAMGSIERTLALGEPPFEDLERLQKLVEEEAAHPGLVVALRGERASMHLVMEGVAKGTINLRDLEGSRKPEWSLGDHLMAWRFRGVARRERAKMLEMFTRAVEIAKRPTHEQPAAEKDLDAEVRELPAGSVLRMLFPAVSKFSDAFRRKLAQTRSVAVLLAVERYRREKGAWPAKLSELAPKFISAVPLDPYDGKPLRYRRLPDGVVVYALGPDGRDNGGDVDWTRRTPPPADMGHRLWDVKSRRQPAKPPKPPPAEGLVPPGGPAVAE
jgi:hypothetical protein